MSYILEALKKSERTRQRDVIPDLQSVHEIALEEEPRKKRSWMPVLVLVLFLNALLMVWMFSPDEEMEVVARAPAIDAAVPADDLDTAVAPGHTEPQKTTVSTTSPVVMVDDDAPATANKTDLMVEKEQAQATDEIPASLPAPVMPEAVTLEVNTEDTIQPVSGPRDQDQQNNRTDRLPLAKRSALPEIEISIHAYAENPSARMVRINGRMLREGQAVTDDLTVEEITTEGIVFDYMGERITRKVKK